MTGNLMTKQHQHFLSAQLTLTMVAAPVGREVRCVVPEDSECGSAFFLSYARAEDSSEYVGKFFRDLAANVTELISLPADVPAGFMDQQMRGGMQLTDALLRAAGTCQVLVALLSARYLRSEWCRMEWHAFSLRKVRHESGKNDSLDQGCIIPVIWAPLPVELPPHISSRLVFSPTLEADPGVYHHYQENGIFGLMRMGKLKDAYDIVAWQLALHIARIYHCHWVEHRDFEISELRSILGSDGRGS